jgi:hypothetical protein
VLLPGALAAAALAHIGEAGHAVVAGGGAGTAGAAGGGTAGAAGGGAAASAGGGAATSAAGVAGAGGAAAGGGWLFAGGPLSAKLAVGCLLALGVGAGCLTLEGDRLAPVSRHRHHTDVVARADASGAGPGADQLAQSDVGESTTRVNGSAGEASAGTLTPAAKATREFGPQPSSTPGSTRSVVAAGGHATARVASSHSAPPVAGSSGQPASDGTSAAHAGEAQGGAAAETGVQALGASGAGDSTTAEREFTPG